MKTIAVIASLDTKGREVAYVRDRIAGLGCRALVIDVGVRDEPDFPPDVGREEVVAAAGESWSEIRVREKRERITAMARGVAVLLPDLHARGRIDAVLALGGAQNTTIGTSAMRALPIGVPKLVVSTMASGRRTFEPLVGTKDVMILHTVADVSGLNVITRPVLDNASAAICGMAEHAPRAVSRTDRLVVGATMLGVTTDGVSRAVALVEKAGVEVVTFHATGVGGRAMEELIGSGLVGAVMDLTLHEITCELLGGYSSGATRRLEAAGEAGIPQVVAPGAVDVVDWLESTVAAELPDWSERKRIYQHPTLLHLKLKLDEVIGVARVIAARLNCARGPVTVVLPLQGFHQSGHPGQPLWDPEVDRALTDTLRSGLRDGIRIHEVDANINDAAFSRAAAEELLALLGRRS